MHRTTGVIGLAAAVLLTGPSAAGLNALTLDVALDGIAHSYDPSVGGRTPVADAEVTSVTAADFVGDVGDFDGVVVRATLPDGFMFHVDPPANQNVGTLSFFFQWLTTAGSFPAAGSDFSGAISFLGLDGPAPASNNNSPRGFLRGEGSEIRVNGSFDISALPFSFTGIEVMFNGFFGEGVPPEDPDPTLAFTGNMGFDLQLTTADDPTPFVSIVPVPEPAVLGLGTLGLVLMRRRR